mmetsp:Transcript_18545/g.20695  ORF Transcript_18545/g.20695 Transcript_18545/m.20695 type:complete len:156 (+) Transcript_18545:71-538(+)
MYIGAIKFLHVWEASIPNALALFEMTIGVKNDWFAEVFLRGFSAVQFIAGFLIVINQSKLGAQAFFFTILGFIATTYNPMFNGYSYESITLVVNEASLIGLCYLLYGYENAQTTKKCPFANGGGQKVGSDKEDSQKKETNQKQGNKKQANKKKTQ